MTYITKAASRGVDIEELEVTIEATVDLRGIFELAAVHQGPTPLIRVHASAGRRATVRSRPTP